VNDRLAHTFRAVDHAYFCLDDRGNPFPQTSAAVVIRRMLRVLDVQEGARVLEIGTGSGYSTALLSELIGPAGLEGRMAHSRHFSAAPLGQSV